MTSSEADRFMLEHPEVAVRVISNELTGWIAWDDFGPKGGNMRGRLGSTREHALSEYKQAYHPEKPHYACGDATLPFEDVSKAFRDSAKYRRIVEAFKEYDHPITFIEGAGFIQAVRGIIRDDLKPTHCDKCHQELP